MEADTGGPPAPSSVSVASIPQQQHQQQPQQQQGRVLTSSPLSEGVGSRGGSPPGPAAVVAAALSPGGPLDPGGLRAVERCTEASCKPRKPEESLLRRLRGFTGPEPPDRLELGQSCWALLHRAAAVFPSNPAAHHCSQMRAWVEACLKLYPCGECRSHMALYLQGHPVDADDSVRLSSWLCGAHNHVNISLDKEPFEPSDGEALRTLYGRSRAVRRPDLS